MPSLLRSVCSLATFIVLACSAIPAFAVDPANTRLLSQPAVSDTHLAFAYAGDLWIADLDHEGIVGTPRRLTSHPGEESRPVFSRDGRSLAFTGEYDGNVDAYLVAVDGGAPRRLTWHPDEDLVWGFDPEGRVLFGSRRHDSSRRQFQVYSVDPKGGWPERWPVPSAWSAAVSPDGARVAYNPNRPAFEQWKHYRGGRNSRIWLQAVDDLSVVEVPQPERRVNDADPMWVGDEVYFRSDRAGELNLFVYDPAEGSIEQLTEHEDFPVIAAAAGGGRVVYEQAGYLHLFNPATRQSRRLEIAVTADLPATRTRWVDGEGYLRNYALSPSGARAVFECRGEILTVPGEKGDVRNLTRTSGAHERSPIWSPDGTRIAYFSDASGEYALHVAPQDGRGEARVYALDGSGFYEDPKFSPDGRWISFVDNSWSLYILELESGQITKVFSEVLYGPFRTLHHAWSPDSRWLAHTRITEAYFQVLHLYSIAEGRSRPVTGGLADIVEPVFDAGGKYLYFAASTDAGPFREWFSQHNVDVPLNYSLYLAVLPSGEVSPLARESDEEAGSAEEEAGSAEEEAGSAEELTVEVDFEGLEQRVIALPAAAATLGHLRAGAAGQLYYLVLDTVPHLFNPRRGELRLFDLGQRSETTLSSGVGGFALSGDGKKILVERRGQYTLTVAGQKIGPEAKPLPVGAIRVRIDPRQEWEQIYNEAWRINRDYFYDPGMHGADWPALREKYSVFLPHLATRRDLNRVLRWMSSELAVGHHRVGGGDYWGEDAVEDVPVGLLGADFSLEEGRYRFARVYGGLYWDPALRSPLTEPGVEVEAGEFLLAVDGEPLSAGENLYRFFENTAGRIVELTVGSDPSGEGARTVEVVPIESESRLRRRAWVEDNRRRVDEATAGRVAYVWVPDTWQSGHVAFKRSFFPQTAKEALILDERFNGGGLIADYYIDLLQRRHLAHWAMRYGADLPTPLGAIEGPKVMLIDQNAGSGGDMLPWMFRQLELGPLIGKRTWGGLVGILGFPVLIDGGSITAPNVAFWSEEEGFGIENVGVPPDIEVEQWPAEVEAGGDPQLEKAIEVVLEKLELYVPHAPERPPYPLRARP